MRFVSSRATCVLLGPLALRQVCRRLRDATQDGAMGVISNATMTFARQKLSDLKRAQEGAEQRMAKRSASYEAEQKRRALK